MSPRTVSRMIWRIYVIIPLILMNSRFFIPGSGKRKRLGLLKVNPDKPHTEVNFSGGTLRPDCSRARYKPVLPGKLISSVFSCKTACPNILPKSIPTIIFMLSPMLVITAFTKKILLFEHFYTWFNFNAEEETPLVNQNRSGEKFRNFAFRHCDVAVSGTL